MGIWNIYIYNHCLPSPYNLDKGPIKGLWETLSKTKNILLFLGVFFLYISSLTKGLSLESEWQLGVFYWSLSGSWGSFTESEWQLGVFTGVWVTAILLTACGLSLIFSLTLTMLWSGWSWFFLWFPIRPDFSKL